MDVKGSIPNRHIRQYGLRARCAGPLRGGRDLHAEVKGCPDVFGDRNGRYAGTRSNESDLLPRCRAAVCSEFDDPERGAVLRYSEASRAFDDRVLRHRLFRTAAPFRVLRKATPNLDQANRVPAWLGERTEIQRMDRSIEKGVI